MNSGHDCQSENGVMGLRRSGNSGGSQSDRFSACSKEDFFQWFKDEEDGSSCLASTTHDVAKTEYILIQTIFNKLCQIEK